MVATGFCSIFALSEWTLSDGLCGQESFISLLLEPRARFRCDCVILTSVGTDRTTMPVCFGPGDFGMNAVGFLMLVAGWFLVLAAIVLFASPPLRTAFVLAGIAVETLGLILVFRSHLIPREEKR